MKITVYLGKGTTMQIADRTGTKSLYEMRCAIHKHAREMGYTKKEINRALCKAKIE